MPGGTLARRIAAEREAGRLPLDVEEVAGVAAAMSSALLAIHGAGVVHRDLKPENILGTGRAAQLSPFGCLEGRGSGRG